MQGLAHIYRTACLLGAAIITGPVAAHDKEPAGNPGAAALDTIAPALSDPLTDVLRLQPQRDQRFSVPVMIDDKGPFRFMIDTGSQATAVSREVSSALGLVHVGRVNLLGMASLKQVDMAAINRLTVGRHHIDDISAPVLERDNIGADGIIGLDALQDFRVLIDFRTPSMAVQDMRGVRRPDAGFEIVVRAQPKMGQLLITNALVDGIRTTVIIDTGAETSMANPVLRDKLRRKRESEIVTTDVNGVDLIGHVAVVRSLKLASLNISNVPLAFADSPVFAALGLAEKPALALGMQHLKLFNRVAIDFASNKLLFDVPKSAERTIPSF
ncbi:MAG: retroviral-like aspartic protease family protein [Erythrobacter sp.]